MRLNRNFIALTSAKEYYETIKNKLKFESQINEKEVDELFRILNYYENNNKDYYSKIMQKLSEYTENFVLNNATYILYLLKLSEEERKIIMVEFDNLNYSNDLNVLDFIKHIQDVFILRINNYIKNIIEHNDCDKEQYLQMALDIKNNNDNNFKIQIMEEVLQIFPSINKEPIFCKLFMDLYLKINEIGYGIFKNEIRELESKKELPFLDYQIKSIRKMMTEEIKQK